MNDKVEELSANTQDVAEYLHINENAVLRPSHQSRLQVCKLLKMCILSLYGGSKSQRYSFSCSKTIYFYIERKTDW